ncbi:MAG: DUF3426 domain-containing protein [Myxococcales bacterium]|nr:DUF3426 domain-containing protein [Myxococcales bacterium]
MAGAHMMMQCPRCSTRWRVAAAAPVENPLFKCGKCHHLFRQFPGATPARESAATATATATKRRATADEPDTLEFIFPERQPAELPATDDRTSAGPQRRGDIDAPSAAAATASAREPATARDTTSPPARSARAQQQPALSIVPSEAKALTAGGDREPATGSEPSGTSAERFAADGAPFAGGDGAESALDTTAAAAGDDTEAVETFAAVGGGRRLRVEETMRTTAGFGTIMRAIAAAVAGFAVLTLLVRAAPERTAAWLARLPLAGVTFANDRNLARRVELANVQGRYQRLRSSRRVFVITGEARNNSAKTIERIEVAGVLYGLGGGELDQKIVTTGNRTTLTDLSEAEITLLQRLDPVIGLAPGESTPFAIVFLDPPRELREFSSKVMSVRPTRRASSPSANPPRDPVG